MPKFQSCLERQFCIIKKYETRLYVYGKYFILFAINIFCFKNGSETINYREGMV
jgi:hypothetical protein